MPRRWLGWVLADSSCSLRWDRGFNVLGEFDTDRFEANEICFEGHRISHLVCVPPDRFPGRENSGMFFFFHNCGQKRGMLDDECAFHCFLLPITRKVKPQWP